MSKRQQDDRRKDHRTRVLHRIAAQKGAPASFCTYGLFGVEEVRCKGCGTPIRKLTPDPRFQQIERQGAQTVVRERMVLATLPNYREILVECDDGSAHSTGVCAQCYDTLDNNPEKLEMLYALDCNELLNECRNAKQPDSVINWNQWAHRRAVKVVRD